MKSENLNITLPLSFHQIVSLIKQLPDEKKLRIKELISKELNVVEEGKESIVTHIASEGVLSSDWLLSEEEEAWKDL